MFRSSWRVVRLPRLVTLVGVSALAALVMVSEMRAQTVDPAAVARGLPLQLLPLSGAELSGCSPALASPLERLPASDDPHADLVARIRALPAGSRVLVAGHSNTVPALAKALGAPSLCPELLPLDDEGRCWLAHDAYDDVFVLSLPEQGEASVLRLTVKE